MTVQSIKFTTTLYYDSERELTESERVKIMSLFRSEGSIHEMEDGTFVAFNSVKQQLIDPIDFDTYADQTLPK